MKKKIALVCVAKEEDYYLQEWIDYHLKLGFDDIHIFQNNWRFNNPRAHNQVHFHEWDITTKIEKSNIEPIWEWNLQAKCYTDFARNFNEQYEWGAFFDVDEFLVLKETTDVKEFIKNYDDHNCLVINWALFGDNGLTEFDEANTGVIERFTKRWSTPHTEGGRQFKSICKLHKDMTHNTHWASNTPWIDPNFTRGDGPFNYQFNFDKAQLNHYYTKTYPEWENKSNKTRCDGVDGTLLLAAFHQNNFNDIEDLHALNFSKGEKKKKE